MKKEIEIKWSKKEVIERPRLCLGSAKGRFKEREPIGGTYKVDVYHWEDYRLEKELVGTFQLYSCNHEVKFQLQFFQVLV